MQFGKDPAGTFKTMAGDSNKLKSTSDSKNTSFIHNGDNEITRRLTFPSEDGVIPLEDPNKTSKQLTLQSVPDDSDSCRLSPEVAEQLSPHFVNTRLKTENATELKDVSLEHRQNTKQHIGYDAEDKEDTALPSTTGPAGNMRQPRRCGFTIRS